MLKENAEIYCLIEYRWVKCELLSTGKVNHKVKFQIPGCIEQISYLKKDRCAFPDEIVAVVWDLGKGKNGRGAYRVERELYPELRVPACEIGSWTSPSSKGLIKEMPLFVRT
jgi:hypothetical protein